MLHIPVGVSARHIHLTEEHILQLFGEPLKEYKSLTQPSQFAAIQTLTIEGPKRSFERVRVLGPARPYTQIEISRTDAIALGLDPPIRESGYLHDTPGVKLIGSHGELQLDRGLIIAARHIHFHPSEAANWGIQNKQQLKVRIEGKRSLTFENVIARVSPHFSLEMHIDTDEANAADLKNHDRVYILSEEL